MHKRREHYIIGRALYEAIRHLDRLPEDQRPQSDMDDMVELLKSRYEGVLGIMLAREDLKPLPPPIARLVPRPKPPDEKS